YNLAKSLSLNGWVNNTGEGVIIDVEGNKSALDAFVSRISEEAPPLSLIRDISVRTQPVAYYSSFEIRESSDAERKNVYISPDVAVCDDCKQELFDKNNRRYMYPFINCTNCGHRFTIIKDIPYDRVNTTMKQFEMCEACESEYRNPSDRRYHAQLVSCFDCGPRLELINCNGTSVCTENAIMHAKELLADGNIIAVKGLGGYHLFCDAANHETVVKLRKRKVRDDKPFALMVRDYETANKFCYCNAAERSLLESKEKPIVLLKKREEIKLPNEIAPGNPYLGIMLPYTPVHLLLLASSETHAHKYPEALVATSGNRSSEPIYFKDKDALDNLSGIADYFLVNDREIYIRTDDSVTRVFRDKEYLIRRSRGYAPSPVTCKIGDIGKEKGIPSVLACGGELKNTFCMNNGNEFFVSHHIGDLENNETLSSFEDGIRHYKNLFGINPEIAAFDLHPEYLSTKYALDLDLKKVVIQHHHAHIASCMAENNLDGDVIGVAFDGTGYGEDGNIWGGEFFSGSYDCFKREGHIEYVSMPGGEMAIKEPWRMAVAYLYKCSKGVLAPNEAEDLIKGIDSGRIGTIIQMIGKGINSPLTSSAGRLFDAVSALLGICMSINYEGQAAIELEYVALQGAFEPYEFTIVEKKDSFEICVDQMIKSIVHDIKAGVEKQFISAKFHETIAEIIAAGSSRIREKTQLNRVILSGGVFQNLTLLDKSVVKLENAGFKVFVHNKVPSNDAGISLGQAAIAIIKSKRQ
ncbi:MAG TPA: carbamoyltransferase HypF, partial [Clostridia bacterium]|nr:carbamoyltransferase HypF [Clostridia bacterium]